MESEEVQLLVIISSSILFAIIIFIVIIFSVFQRRKNQLLIEKAEQRQKFELELANSQSEIQEQTLKNISWELHDNVGQLLSVAKLQLNMLTTKVKETNKKALEEVGEVIGKSLHDIRMLSRTLNHEVLQNIGLVEAIKMELQRFNRVKFLEASIDVKGEERQINNKDEIIIFRIFQEFFSNVTKHSKASELQVKLDYETEKLTISAEDNGVGFNMNEVKSGLGLINMKSRAELIKADFYLTSKYNEGVKLKLVYPYKNQNQNEQT
ncbi:sensor histidine kinase [Spongiivirga citrea]|uniref:histidine kinase n=1 Tax=Spongiivirga citrea TaxID=1481457 RepID=A0A6M0CK55_9FLAO|nr:histidine kinase [Spongiivirga citrea]NER16374.1 histidine kinase [Spongiivirga citrea]